MCFNLFPRFFKDIEKTTNQERAVFAAYISLKVKRAEPSFFMVPSVIRMEGESRIKGNGSPRPGSNPLDRGDNSAIQGWQKGEN